MMYVLIVLAVVAVVSAILNKVKNGALWTKSPFLLGIIGPVVIGFILAILNIINQLK